MNLRNSVRFIDIVLFLYLSFMLISCKKHSPEDLITYKDTFHDDIADITFIDDHFYTTNYDVSGNSGSQIDLLKFSSDGNFVEDAFNLKMNGQGYFAITNDGKNLYLQSRTTSIIIQLSIVGEKGYETADDVDYNQWQTSGICYTNYNDSLVLLYRNILNPIQYRARMVSKLNPTVATKDMTFQFDSVSTTDNGIYAIAYKDSSFYLLGTNPSRQDILIIANYNFSYRSIEYIPDSTVVGLCFKGDDLYLSYRDRRIEKWKTY